MEKVQRLVFDEPHGICVGFSLSREELKAICAEADEWDLVSDDKHEDSMAVICDADTGNEIRIRPRPTLEELDAVDGVFPFGMDAMIWRSRAELAEWLFESHWKEVTADWCAKHRIV